MNVELTALLEITLAVVGAAGLAGVAWAVSRVKGVEVTLSLMAKQSDAQRQIIEEQRLEIEQGRVAVAELKGKVDLLTSEMGARIVDAVVDALHQQGKRIEVVEP